MNKNCLLLAVVFICANCVSESECQSISTELSAMHEEQLYKDIEKDRRGFIKIIRQFESEIGSYDEAFPMLTSDTILDEEKSNILNKYGPLLLSSAVLMGDKEKVAFYLESGVDSLVYHKHIGIVILDLTDANDYKILKVFQDYFNKNNISSSLLGEIEIYYDKCI
jgi:hypothetical protein